jgi:hypothetical protein
VSTLDKYTFPCAEDTLRPPMISTVEATGLPPSTFTMKSVSHLNEKRNKMKQGE